MSNNSNILIKAIGVLIAENQALKANQNALAELLIEKGTIDKKDLSERSKQNFENIDMEKVNKFYGLNIEE